MAAHVESFPLEETTARLAELLLEWTLVLDPRRRSFVSSLEENPPAIRFIPPGLLPVSEQVTNAQHYMDALPQPISSQLLLLVQAGATAMGYWQGPTLLAHKVIKKYVTRGKGKAQSTYLKTRGKSRYGSRLRLQNARAHLRETNQKLLAWWAEYGAVKHIFYSCPVRMWPELFSTEPAPPFTREDACSKVALDVHRPNFDELLRVHRFLRRGFIERA